MFYFSALLADSGNTEAVLSHSKAFPTLLQQNISRTSEGIVPQPKPTPPETLETPLSQMSPRENSAGEFIVFPVGIYVGNRQVIESTDIRGRENGSQAVNLKNWFISFDKVKEALKLNVTTLGNEQLEIRSPGLVKRINLQDLKTDPEIGLVISVEQIETLLGVPTQFDIVNYALVFNPPWLSLRSARTSVKEVPVNLDGLPEAKPPNLNLTSMRQQVNISRSNNNPFNYQGDLTTVGAALGGSLYLRLNQSNLRDTSTWQLNQAQFFHPSDFRDYVIGSQSPFWRSQASGEFWGLTTIQRWGFTPPKSLGGGGFNASSRLQTNAVKRTIAGVAKPGTLVQLVEGFNTNVIDEVLVDSSGLYRFKDVSPQGRLGNYQVLLYPNGQLTVEPEIIAAEFTSLPGQLSKGDSALVVSAGMRRETSGNNNLIGKFSDFRGGVAYRRGVTEELTMGVGAVYDRSERVLGEIFYLPKALPVEVAISALSPLNGKDIDINSSIRFQPSRNFTADLSSDRFSQRFNINWQAFPNLTFIANSNSRDAALAAGFQYNYSNSNFYTFTRATFDTNNRLRWNLIARWQNLLFSQQGNELGTNSELNYAIAGSSYNSTQSLFATYEDRNSNSLGTFGWRYRSPKQLVDGSYPWQIDLGYGIGSQGSGLVASVATAVLPAIDLRLLYQGISNVSNDSSFRLQIVPRLNFAGGISAGDRRLENLRNQGGLLIQPFFDKNNNSQRDAGEEIYTTDADLLILLNNKSLNSFRPEIRSNGIYITLPQDTYRLDLDPAGFPTNWQTTTQAYAVEVAPGSYTPVVIPFALSYTVAGTVTDAEGKAVGGAKVEAVPTSEGKKVFSITNGAGIFFLEGLQQGKYNLLINGKSAQPSTFSIDTASQPVQEINLRY